MQTLTKWRQILTYLLICIQLLTQTKPPKKLENTIKIKFYTTLDVADGSDGAKYILDFCYSFF